MPTPLQGSPNRKYVKARFLRPTVIKWYNRGVGGTNLFNQRLSYYSPNVRTKRWPHRNYFHFLNCSVVHAFILYKVTNNQHSQADLKDQLPFQLKLVKAMVVMNDRPVFTATPTLIDDSLPTSMSRFTTVAQAQLNFDVHHYPLHYTHKPGTKKHNRMSCRYEGRTNRGR